ncbi:MAG: metal ABC transporter permease [Pirellulales bacterium]
MNWLFEPLQHAFLRQALLASLLVGATCSLLGVHVLLRRMTFFGDAIAHTTLPGLVIAYLNRWNLFLGAVVAALLAAIGISWLCRRRRLHEDAAIGVTLSGMFALGVVLISRTRSFRDFSHMLFGNVLAVTSSDLLGILLVFLLVVTTLWLLHKELLASTLDPVHSSTIGLNVERIRDALLVLLALGVVTGIQAVGVVLTTALMITPAATASLITRRLTPMLICSVVNSSLACIVGLYASYYWSVSSGGAIVLSSTLLFGLVLVVDAVRRFRISARDR